CSESNSWKYLVEGVVKTQGFSSSTGIATNAIIQAHPVPSAGETMDMCDLDRSRSLPPASITLVYCRRRAKKSFQEHHW
ncbi:unnamed protein product, partial [Gulo gulo]